MDAYLNPGIRFQVQGLGGIKGLGSRDIYPKKM